MLAKRGEMTYKDKPRFRWSAADACLQCPSRLYGAPAPMVGNRSFMPQASFMGRVLRVHDAVKGNPDLFSEVFINVRNR